MSGKQLYLTVNERGLLKINFTFIAFENILQLSS